MGLITTTASSTGFVAQVRCDDCQAEAAKAEHADQSRARKRAKRLAEDAGFVWYDGGKTWVCPACRIRRLPDKMKAEFPKLCERYGIPVPTVQPDRLPTRRVRKRRRRTATEKERRTLLDSDSRQAAGRLRKPRSTSFGGSLHEQGQDRVQLQEGLAARFSSRECSRQKKRCEPTSRERPKTQGDEANHASGVESSQALPSSPTVRYPVE